jgi:hypothetical protein
MIFDMGTKFYMGVEVVSMGPDAVAIYHIIELD